jgi:hypothetical protein
MGHNKRCHDERNKDVRMAVKLKIKIPLITAIDDRITINYQ